MKKIMKKTLLYIPSIIILLAIVFLGQGSGDFLGIKSAFGYGGGGGGGGWVGGVSPTITSSNQPMTILPSQEGNATMNFGDQGSVGINVPAGAISGETTFNIQQGTANSNQMPSNTVGAFMIGNKIFNINGEDTMGNAVRDFNSNLTITITLPDMPADTTGLGVYYFNDTTNEWVLVPGATFDPANGKVVFQVNHLTEFAVIKGDGQTVIKVAGGQVLGEQTFADGALIRANGDIDVYIVKYVGDKQFKRLILSPFVFNSYEHLRWGDVMDVEQSVVNSFTTSELVRAVNDTKVYRLAPNGDKGQKRWVKTMGAFAANGFDWDAVYEINSVDRDAYTLGQDIE